MSDLLDVFNIKDLVKEPTCFMSDKRCLIDIFLTIKLRFFYIAHVFVTSIRDFHKLLVTVLRSYYKKLLRKNILYRITKSFEKTTFPRDLYSRLIQCELYINFQEPDKKLSKYLLKYQTSMSCKTESSKR